MRNVLMLAAIPFIASCVPAQLDNDGAALQVARADLVRSDGVSVGVATLSQRRDGLWLSITADSPGEGSFGTHIHAVGRCDGPDFVSAGPHWNPGAKQHGHDNPLGSHAGDLSNMTAGPDRRLKIETQLNKMALGGEVGLLDADGAAIVIHEKADDYKTDPSGNSGKRIICGVFSKP